MSFTPHSWPPGAFAPGQAGWGCDPTEGSSLQKPHRASLRTGIGVGSWVWVWGLAESVWMPQVPAQSPDELHLTAAELTLFMHNLALMDIWNGTDQRREDLASVK